MDLFLIDCRNPISDAVKTPILNLLKLGGLSRSVLLCRHGPITHREIKEDADYWCRSNVLMHSNLDELMACCLETAPRTLYLVNFRDPIHRLNLNPNTEIVLWNGSSEEL